MIKNGWGAKSLRRDLEAVLSQVPKNDWEIEFVEQKSGINYEAYGYPPLIVSKAYNLMVKGKCVLSAVYRVHDRQYVIEGDYHMRQPEGYTYTRDDIRVFQPTEDESLFPSRIYAVLREMCLERSDGRKYDGGKYSFLSQLQIPENDWEIEFVEQKSGINYEAYGYPPLIVSKAYNLMVKGKCVLSAVYRVHDRRYVIKGDYHMRQPDGYTYARGGIRGEDASRIYAVLQEMCLERSGNRKYNQDKGLFLIQLEKRISQIVNCKKEFLR